MELKNRIKILKLKIPICLKIFLKSYNLDTCYCQSQKKYDRHSHGILDIFNDKLRFKLINNKDSQDSYIGYWTFRNKKLSKFEKLYYLWYDMPFQIFDEYMGFIYDNPIKILLQYKLSIIEEEHIHFDLCFL